MTVNTYTRESLYALVKLIMKNIERLSCSGILFYIMLICGLFLLKLLKGYSVRITQAPKKMISGFIGDIFVIYHNEL